MVTIKIYVEWIGLNVVVVMSDLGRNFQRLAKHLKVRKAMVHAQSEKVLPDIWSSTSYQMHSEQSDEIHFQVWAVHSKVARYCGLLQ